MRGIAIVAAVLLLAGCHAPKTQITALERPPDGARLVLMPLDVELYEIPPFGGLEPRAEWTENAKTWLTEALQQEKTARGLRLSLYDAAALDDDKRERLDQIERVHALLGRSILQHHYILGHDLPTKERSFDWSLGPKVQALKEATDARYALFVVIRDSYSSLGRRAVQVAMTAILLSPVPGGLQTGFASLVDLETGKIVWYNRLLRDFGDLRTPEAARSTARALLDGLPS
jgi:hypothetical protein